MTKLKSAKTAADLVGMVLDLREALEHSLGAMTDAHLHLHGDDTTQGRRATRRLRSAINEARKVLKR